MIGNSLFGFEYGQSIQVYYLIVAWMMIAAVGMYFHTMTPLGRMANACRDNHERAQFVGYDPRIVRFLQFALSGFYAGIGGGLFAITYEIVTFDAVAAPLAANALLMAYIGGATTFFGPVLGAILITLLQSGVSLMSNSWLVYVGVLFIAMVTFAPAGLTGIVLEHAPIARAGLLRRLRAALSAHPGPRAGRAVRLRRAGGAAVVPHHRHGAGQAPRAVRPRDRHLRHGALAGLAGLPAGRRLLAARAKSAHFKRVWDGLIEIAQPGDDVTAVAVAARRHQELRPDRDHPRRRA